MHNYIYGIAILVGSVAVIIAIRVFFVRKRHRENRRTEVEAWWRAITSSDMDGGGPQIGYRILSPEETLQAIKEGGAFMNYKEILEGQIEKLRHIQRQMTKDTMGRMNDERYLENMIKISAEIRALIFCANTVSK